MTTNVFLTSLENLFWANYNIDISLLLNSTSYSLQSHYNLPNRYYHNERHVTSLMLLANPYFDVKSQFLSKRELEIVLVLSILFHDMVYNPFNNLGVNELLSAKAARNFIDNSLVKSYLVTEFSKNTSFNENPDLRISFIKHYISNIIMSTVKHECVKDFIEPEVINYFLDLDLMILASNSDEYIEYSKNIQKEYDAISLDAFYNGRLRFIGNKVLDCDSRTLFKSEKFKNNVFLLEKAKSNLLNEREYIINWFVK